jgi:hypothetical protein
MKNFISYINPQHHFLDKHVPMMEAQIDNALEYWDRKDIIVLTNFSYEYNGIKSIVAPDELINNEWQLIEKEYLTEEKRIGQPSIYKITNIWEQFIYIEY